ncbi:MAG TPA: hypothetical protein DEF47_01410 [Herpetosiphon sp.]|nr:hypothetical protein [Herpetosiphon sp.]
MTIEVRRITTHKTIAIATHRSSRLVDDFRICASALVRPIIPRSDYCVANSFQAYHGIVQSK